jgi:chromosome segregation ATPase
MNSRAVAFDPAAAEDIRLWLANTFYGGSVAALPSLSDESLAADQCKWLTHLQRLRQAHAQRAIERKAIVADAAERAHSYAFEARRLKQLNEATGITAEQLSRSGRTSLTTLVECADELHLKDVRPSSYMIALHNLSHSTGAALEACVVAERQAVVSEQICTDARRDLADVRRAVKQASSARDAEASKLAERKKQTPMLRQVAEDCRTAVANDKRQLAALGVTKEVFHSELQRRAQRIEDVERELAPLNMALQNFRGLPPDLSLAQARVDQAEQEMRMLQSELTKELEGLGFAS